MHPSRHDSQRLNDILFALVLAAAAISAGLLAWVSAEGGADRRTLAAPAQLQLERVVVTALREPIAARTVELPRVVVSAKRLAPVKAVARAAAQDPNS